MLLDLVLVAAVLVYGNIKFRHFDPQLAIRRRVRCSLRRKRSASRLCGMGRISSSPAFGAARALLEAGDPVQDVARAVGFSGAPAFARLFRSRYGVTPGAMRRSRRQTAVAYDGRSG